jgi:hypothetical protein
MSCSTERYDTVRGLSSQPITRCPDYWPTGSQDLRQPGSRVTHLSASFTELRLEKCEAIHDALLRDEGSDLAGRLTKQSPYNS